MSHISEAVEQGRMSRLFAFFSRLLCEHYNEDVIHEHLIPDCCRPVSVSTYRCRHCGREKKRRWYY